MIRVVVYICSLLICISAQSQDSVATNVQALNSIKALAGSWKGTFQWIGKKSNGQMDAHYYLTAGNQPHLKMVAMDPQQHTIRFDMTSITNMAAAGAAHVHALELTIEDKNHLRILFRFMQAGNENLEDIHLVRSDQ